MTLSNKKDKYTKLDEEELDEISLSSKDPEDFTPQEPGSDFVGPDAYGDQPSDYMGWSESKKLGKPMKVSRSQLRKILNEEAKKFLFEDCGCGGAHPAIAHPGEYHDQEIPEMPYGSVSMEDSDGDMVSGALSKSEAIALVSMIADRTSCPVTQQALMGVVDDLSGQSEDFADGTIIGLF